MYCFNFIYESTNNIDALDRAENYRMDAAKAWRIAEEMLEEAQAEKNNAAKLGAMGNAEEKEMIAIAKQTKAINLLNKSTSDMTFLTMVNLPIK